MVVEPRGSWEHSAYQTDNQFVLEVRPVKIDPNNPKFRLMLAEFFIAMKLMKRAEGELNRLLAIFPSNREARELLASLQA